MFKYVVPLCLTALLLPCLLQGQTVFKTELGLFTKDDGNQRIKNWYRIPPEYNRTQAEKPEEAAREFLQRFSLLLDIPADERSLASSKTYSTPYFTYVVFEQRVDDVPVYDGTIRVAIDKEKRIRGIQNQTASLRAVRKSMPVLNEETAKARARSAYAERARESNDKSSLVYYPVDERFLLAWRVLVQLDRAIDTREIIVDAASGDILADRSTVFSCGANHLHGGKQFSTPRQSVSEVDNTATAKVFLAPTPAPMPFEQRQGTGTIFYPDPLSSSGASYGDAGFTDRHDSTSPQLTAQLLSVTLDSIRYDEALDTYSLIGPYCRIYDLSPPHYPGDINAYVRSSSDFSVDRNDSTFEAVMAYYYIWHAQKRVQQLGYYEMRNSQINVDPHLDTINAYYQSGENRISLGGWGVDSVFVPNGGVDAGEDAGIIIHEYAHALHDAYGALEIADCPEKSVAEGFADYFAGSYLRSIDGTINSLGRWGLRYQAEGSKPPRFFDDQTLTFNDVYSFPVCTWEVEPLIYANGKIWASTLMAVREAVGRDLADKIALENVSWGPTSLAEASEFIFDLNLPDILRGNPDSLALHNTICGIFLARSYPIEYWCDPDDFTAVTVHNNFEHGAEWFEKEKWVYNDNCSAPLLSGVPMMLPRYDTISFRSEFPRYDGADSLDQTSRHHFHNWYTFDGDSLEAHFTYRQSAPVFDEYNMNSMLKKLSPAVLVGGLELPASGAPMLLRNPWRTEGSCHYTQPQTFQQLLLSNDTASGGNFGSFTQGGIFLDQGGLDLYAPEQPYYTARASQALTFSLQHKTIPFPMATGDFFFHQWSKPLSSSAIYWDDPYNGQTPPNPGYENPDQYDTKYLRFLAENDTLKAEYKAHMLSNAECPTCVNSQRKIDYDQWSNTYYNTYESSGKSWMTYSTDGGTTWSKEKELFLNNPSLAADESICYIATAGWATPSDRIIGLGAYVGSNAVAYYNFGHNTCSPNANPVVETDLGRDIVLTVWEEQNGRLEFAVLVADTVFATGIVPMSYATALYPSLAHKPGATDYFVSWKSGDSIYCAQLRINPPSPLQWFVRERISVPGQFAVSGPSATVDSLGYPAVAWGSWTQQQGYFISFRQRINGNWGGSATMLASAGSEYRSPTIMGISNVNPTSALRIAHNWKLGVIQHPIRVQRLMNGYWQAPAQQQPNSSNPSLVAYPPQNAVREAFQSSNVSFPGFQQIAFTNLSLQKQDGIMQSAREIVLEQDTTRYSLRLFDAEIMGSSAPLALDWNTGFDTLIVGKTKAVRDYLRTAPFEVPSNGVLQIRLATDRYGALAMPDSAYLRFRVVDASSKAVLQQVGQTQVKNVMTGFSSGVITAPLSGLQGRNVCFEAELEGRDTSWNLYSIDYYLPSDGEFPKAAVETNSIFESAPQQAVLHQNVPNPFNPSTSLSFSLSEAGNATLSVFDNLGRLVATLTGGYHQAGTHRYSFNAEGLPSGVYYYRLETETVSLTKTMTLVR